MQKLIALVAVWVCFISCGRPVHPSRIRYTPPVKLNLPPFSIPGLIPVRGLDTVRVIAVPTMVIQPVDTVNRPVIDHSKIDSLMFALADMKCKYDSLKRATSATETIALRKKLDTTVRKLAIANIIAVPIRKAIKEGSKIYIERKESKRFTGIMVACGCILAGMLWWVLIVFIRKKKFFNYHSNSV